MQLSFYIKQISCARFLLMMVISCWFFCPRIINMCENLNQDGLVSSLWELRVLAADCEHCFLFHLFTAEYSPGAMQQSRIHIQTNNLHTKIFIVFLWSHVCQLMHISQATRRGWTDWVLSHFIRGHVAANYTPVTSCIAQELHSCR